MTTLTMILAIIGVSYVSWLITKFIVWLDGADELVEAVEPEADICEVSQPVVNHQNAA